MYFFQYMFIMLIRFSLYYLMFGWYLKLVIDVILNLDNLDVLGKFISYLNYVEKFKKRL